jgi:hypothetical protein
MDGLHPNAQGLKVVANCLMPLIDKLMNISDAAARSPTQSLNIHRRTSTSPGDSMTMSLNLLNKG